MELQSYGPVEHAQQQINSPEVKSKLGVGIFLGAALTLILGGIVCLIVQYDKTQKDKMRTVKE
jgi:hypothetical protein